MVKYDTKTGGIIHSLTQYYDQNVVEAGVVSVSSSRPFSSSSQYEAYNARNYKCLFEYDNQLGFYDTTPYANENSSYLIFDFASLKISVIKYTLKLGDTYHNNYYYLRFLLEGSNDNQTWMTIDDRRYESQYTSNFKEVQFTSQNDPTNTYRYIKLT